MPPRPTASEMLTHAHAALIGGLCLLAELSPHDAVLDDDGLVLVSTGVPDADLNCAYVTRLPDNPAAALQRARAFFATRAVPWRLFAWGTDAKMLIPTFEHANFRRARTEPGMLLAPLPTSAPPLPHDLSVAIVRDTTALGQWRDVLAAVFGMPRDGAELLLSPRAFDHPSVTVLLGREDSVPVAIGIGLANFQMVNVNAIGTLPAYRQRGYGEALTWQAALSAPRGGIGAYLNASAMGFPVYARMGFQHVIDYERWVP